MAETADPQRFNDSAHEAYDRGDFREAARLARALRESKDDRERASGDDVLRRLAPDPVIVGLTAACLLFFVAVLFFTLR